MSPLVFSIFYIRNKTVYSSLNVHKFDMQTYINRWSAVINLKCISPFFIGL